MQHSGNHGSAVGGEGYRKFAATLESVLSEAVYDQTALKDDVCLYVAELKKSGMSAQSVIAAVRTLVRDTAGRFPPSDRTEALLAGVLGWCLDEYYRESA